MAKLKQFPEEAPSPAHEAAVTRLIELASEEKSQPNTALALEAPKESGRNSMWKILLQLKPLLPYLTRMLPLLELVGAGQQQNVGLTRELRESVSTMQASQSDLRTAIDDHSLQLKQMEEQLIRTRELTEKSNLLVAGKIETLSKQMWIIGAALAALLLVLIAMVGVVLAHILH
jgi:hypothetical protein